MGRKKALSRKRVKKTLNAGDTMLMNQNDFEAETSRLRQQISEMQQAYNKELHFLQWKSEELTECLKSCTSQASQESCKICEVETVYEMAEEEPRKDDELIGRFSSTSAEQLNDQENYHASLKPVNFSKTEISELNAKITDQGDIIESIRGCIVDNHLSKNVNQASFLVKVGTPLQISRSDERIGTTEHSELDTKSNSRKDLNIGQLALGQKELKEMLLFERKVFEEQLSTLGTLFHEEKNKGDILMLKVNDLNAKYVDVVAEMKSVIAQMEVVKKENGELLECKEILSDKIQEYEDTRELSIHYEDECARLHEENVRLIGTCNDLENTIRDLQQVEYEQIQGYEELKKHCEYLEHVILDERKEFDQQLNMFKKAIEEETRNNKEVVTCLKERIASEGRKYELVVDGYNEKLSILRENYSMLEREKDDKCEKLRLTMAEVVKLSDELSSVRKKLAESEVKVAELRSSISTMQLENRKIEEENILLTTKIGDLKYVVRSVQNAESDHENCCDKESFSSRTLRMSDLIAAESCQESTVGEEERSNASVEKLLSKELEEAVKISYWDHRRLSNQCVTCETSKKVMFDSDERIILYDPESPRTFAESLPTKFSIADDEGMEYNASNEMLKENKVDSLHEQVGRLPSQVSKTRNDEIWKQVKCTELSEEPAKFSIADDEGMEYNASNEMLKENKVDSLHEQVGRLPSQVSKTQNDEIGKQVKCTELSKDQATTALKSQHESCVKVTLEQSRNFAIEMATLKKHQQPRDSETVEVHKNEAEDQALRMENLSSTQCISDRYSCHESLRTQLSKSSGSWSFIHMQENSVERKEDEEAIHDLNDENVPLKRGLCRTSGQFECATNGVDAVCQSSENCYVRAMITRNTKLRFLEEMGFSASQKEESSTGDERRETAVQSLVGSISQVSNVQLDERINQLRQVVDETEMDTTRRTVELQSMTASLLHNRDNMLAVSLNSDLSSLGENADRSHAGVGPNECVDIEMARKSSDFPSKFDAFPSRTNLLPLPINGLKHRRDGIFTLYFRYVLAAYAVILHLMLVYCWFFVACP